MFGQIPSQTLKSFLTHNDTQVQNMKGFLMPRAEKGWIFCPSYLSF